MQRYIPRFEFPNTLSLKTLFIVQFILPDLSSWWYIERHNQDCS